MSEKIFIMCQLDRSKFEPNIGAVDNNFFFFFKIFGGHKAFSWGHWYSYFGVE